MKTAMFEQVLCHFDEDGELEMITRGNGQMYHYKVEKLHFQDFAELCGADRVQFNSLINSKHEVHD